jgi:3-deoxy-D-manno-octulosonic-acid transferase
MHLFYQLGIQLYGLLLKAAALFHPKAKAWVKGRQQAWPKTDGEQAIWIHCASLGEFEQGRPLIEKIKKEQPQQKILLTFFSPSAYEVRKDYAMADDILYLPLDTASNARRFLEHFKPSMAIFVKYEFWPNYLLALQKKDIPTYLLSAIFRKEQHFFQWYGGWHRNILKGISHFFVQNKESQTLLSSIGIEQHSLNGDSRFDRVVEHASTVRENEKVNSFKGSHPLIVAGSSWTKDEDLLIAFAQQSDYKIIFAPHELNQVDHLKEKCQAALYSQANTEELKNSQFLIIDSIGLLSQLYAYADIAYVGGGFGAGIHNILEAAVYDCPVVFGPNYQKFQEAKDLIKLGGARSIHELNSLKAAVKYFEEHAVQNKAYCLANSGGTALAYHFLFQQNQ